MNRDTVCPRIPSVFGLIILILTALPAAAEPPEIAWTATFGGSADDWGWATAPTSDGGYVLAGSTDPTGAGVGDAYLVKIDASGRLEWERTYGGAAVDIARAVVQTPDGGFVMAGDSGVPPTAMDVLIIRTDAEGEEIWSTTVGGPALEKGNGLCATFDGGFVVCGDTQSYGSGGNSFYLVKVEADGQLAWQRAYGGGDDHAAAVRETADHGLVFCGYSGNGELVPELTARLYRVNGGGGLVWQRSYSASTADRAFDVHVLPDGDIALAGTESSYLSLRRISAVGALRWSQAYLTVRGYNAIVEASPRGGFFIAGSTYQTDGGNQIVLMETDGAGARQSVRYVGGVGREYGHGIAMHQGGDLMVVGATSSEGSGGMDLYAVGFDIGSVSGTERLPGLPAEHLRAAPNPFNPRVQISFVTEREGMATVKVFDLRGRHVSSLHEGPVGPGTHEVSWSGRDRAGLEVPSGTYLVQLVTIRGSAVRKVSLIR